MVKQRLSRLNTHNMLGSTGAEALKKWNGGRVPTEGV